MCAQDSAGQLCDVHTTSSDITGFTSGITCIPTDTRTDCKFTNFSKNDKEYGRKNNENKIVTPTDENVREELQKICNEIDRAITSAGGRSKLKASPLLRLYDKQLLRPSYIMAEYPRVMDKTSKLSSAMRRTVKELMDSALRHLAWEVFKELNMEEDSSDCGPPKPKNDGTQV